MDQRPQENLLNTWFGWWWRWRRCTMHRQYRIRKSCFHFPDRFKNIENDFKHRPSFKDNKNVCNMKSTYQKKKKKLKQKQKWNIILFSSSDCVLPFYKLSTLSWWWMLKKQNRSNSKILFNDKHTHTHAHTYRVV